jgi:hypothetical protein
MLCEAWTIAFESTWSPCAGSTISDKKIEAEVYHANS